MHGVSPVESTVVRVLPLLSVLLLAGCAWSGSRTATRTWCDRNSYDCPAIICERIDRRPPPGYRIAEYRWRHAREVKPSPFGPGCGLDDGRPVGGVDAEYGGTEMAPEAPVPYPLESSRPKSSPGPGVFANRPVELSTVPPLRRTAEAAGDAMPEREPVRTSWVFDGPVTR